MANMELIVDSMNANEAATTTNPSPLVRKRERGSECSHKVIEKRRRDRINGCLHELSRLVPAARARQGSGKLEKAEILEMTVEYLKKIQLSQDEDCVQGLVELSGEKAPLSSKDQVSLKVKVLQSFRHGYNECTAEVQKFLAHDNGRIEESGHLTRLLNHLQLRLNEETAKATVAEKTNSPTPSSSPPQRTPSDTPNTTKRPLQEVSSNNIMEDAVGCNISEQIQMEPPNKKLQIAPAGCLALPSIASANPQEASKLNNNVTIPPLVHNVVNSIPAPIQSQQNQQLVHQPFVPAYALHPSGTHYIPIAIQPGVPMSQIGVGNVGVIPAATIAPNVGMINTPFALVSPGTMQFGGANGVVQSAMTSTVTSLQQKMLPISTAEDRDLEQADENKDLIQSASSESIATQTEISCKNDKTVISTAEGNESYQDPN